MTRARKMEVAVTVALLVVAAPVLAAAGLAILVTMGTPILYRERRAGEGGRLFTLLKLRTMRPRPCENWPDELRITPVGRWLRETRLDDLPQLWNVLRGEMALVGPRPLPPEYLSDETLRQTVRPGITGTGRRWDTTRPRSTGRGQPGLLDGAMQGSRAG
jgi:lipopolysaccharide/colanic/teichoic acid biosynthesis glycosyltransferase